MEETTPRAAARQTPPEKFSPVTLLRKFGEFEQNSDAEADRVQYLFRSVIIECGIIPIASGASVASWDGIVIGRLREFLGSAESASLGYAIMRAFQHAEANPEMKMTVVFDQGRMLQMHQNLLQAAATLMTGVAGRPAEVFFPVEGTPGLQAADMVANYFYRYAVAWIEDRNSDAEPHFRHLVQNSPSDEGGVINEYGVFNEDAILAMVDGMRSKRPGLWES